MLPVQLGHISAPAAMGALWEGLATLLLEPGPVPGPGPPLPESGFPWERGGWPRYVSLGLGPGPEEMIEDSRNKS